MIKAHYFWDSRNRNVFFGKDRGCFRAGNHSDFKKTAGVLAYEKATQSVGERVPIQGRQTLRQAYLKLERSQVSRSGPLIPRTSVQDWEDKGGKCRREGGQLEKSCLRDSDVDCS